MVFRFGMVRTIRNPNFQNGRFSLDHLLHKKISSFYIKRPSLDWPFWKFGFRMVHSNTEPFEIRISKCSELECIRNSNVRYSSPHCTGLVHKKKDGIHLSCIQMVRLSGIQSAFQYLTFWHPTFFPPFEYQTSIPTVQIKNKLSCVLKIIFLSKHSSLLTSMSLNPWVCWVIHEVKKTRNNSVVKFLFKNWRKICRHLTQSVAARKTDSGMLKNMKHVKIQSILN